MDRCACIKPYNWQKVGVDGVGLCGEDTLLPFLFGLQDDNLYFFKTSLGETQEFICNI